MSTSGISGNQPLPPPPTNSNSNSEENSTVAQELSLLTVDAARYAENNSPQNLKSLQEGITKLLNHPRLTAYQRHTLESLQDQAPLGQREGQFGNDVRSDIVSAVNILQITESLPQESG